MRRDVVVDFFDGRFLVPTKGFTPDGIGSLVEPVSVVPASDGRLLAAVVRERLLAGCPDVPPLPPEEAMFEKPLPPAGSGARSWREYAKTARGFVLFERKGLWNLQELAMRKGANVTFKATHPETADYRVVADWAAGIIIREVGTK